MKPELLYPCLLLANGLFTLGLLGLLLRRNILLTFLAIELMLNAANLNFLTFSRYHEEPTGAIYVLFGICLAAVEAVIGLGLVIRLFRQHQNLGFAKLAELKW
ncbi:MAG: NADH-quinone oxidoreductase subunit NuoK [Bacteroidia bacterium]|nr:NADH-quinone oxidoreductase subunit NuoK [Bacteroidia bacterium]MDW8088641.1 NADH-quinone oxidoreductase subunit NuoK [Bacteroidia bacterium]